MEILQTKQVNIVTRENKSPRKASLRDQIMAKPKQELFKENKHRKKQSLQIYSNTKPRLYDYNKQLPNYSPVCTIIQMTFQKREKWWSSS